MGWGDKTVTYSSKGSSVDGQMLWGVQQAGLSDLGQLSDRAGGQGGGAGCRASGGWFCGAQGGEPPSGGSRPPPDRRR